MTPWSAAYHIAVGGGQLNFIATTTLRHTAPNLPPTLRVRAIRYQRRGFRACTLYTSLLDPVAYPAAELVALYHERWELELGFDEVKTHTLEREEALRSKTPARITQELWGIRVNVPTGDGIALRPGQSRRARQPPPAPTLKSLRQLSTLSILGKCQPCV